MPVIKLSAPVATLQSCTLRRLKMRKHKILIPESWDAYQRNDFSKPRLWHLPMHRKVLNSLTWNVWFSLYFIIFWRSTTWHLSQNLLYNLAFPLTSSEQFSQGNLRCYLPGLSPKTSHQIKHNSQLLGCEYFLSWQRDEKSWTPPPPKFTHWA